MIEDLKEIMSTTEINETVVLIEKTKSKYIRTKAGLRLVSSETLERQRVTNSHHQSQL